jgi:hypothetical protein
VPTDGVRGCGSAVASAGPAACAQKLDNRITVMLAANSPMTIPMAMMPASSNHKGGRNRAPCHARTASPRGLVPPGFDTRNGQTERNRNRREAPTRFPDLGQFYRPESLS